MNAATLRPTTDQWSVEVIESYWNMAKRLGRYAQPVNPAIWPCDSREADGFSAHAVQWSLSSAQGDLLEKGWHQLLSKESTLCRARSGKADDLDYLLSTSRD